VRILHNTRCCISLAALQYATVKSFMGRRSGRVLRLKSEDSLLNGFGRLREYDRVYAAGSFSAAAWNISRQAAFSYHMCLRIGEKNGRRAKCQKKKTSH